MSRRSLLAFAAVVAIASGALVAQPRDANAGVSFSIGYGGDHDYGNDDWRGGYGWSGYRHSHWRGWGGGYGGYDRCYTDYRRVTYRYWDDYENDWVVSTTSRPYRVCD